MQFLTIKFGVAILQGCILASCGSVLDDSPGRVELQKIRASQTTQDKCIEIAEEYVNKTRGWSRSLYVLTDERSVSKGKGFSVMYQGDLKALFPEGGLRSFHLELDQSCSKVIGELAYQ